MAIFKFIIDGKKVDHFLITIEYKNLLSQLTSHGYEIPNALQNGELQLQK